jgi:hypothetical protein
MCVEIRGDIIVRSAGHGLFHGPCDMLQVPWRSHAGSARRLAYIPTSFRLLVWVRGLEVFGELLIQAGPAGG